jgi:hypothetical protein
LIKHSGKPPVNSSWRHEGAILMAKLKKSTAPLLNTARHIAFTLRGLT